MAYATGAERMLKAIGGEPYEPAISDPRPDVTVADADYWRVASLEIFNGEHWIESSRDRVAAPDLISLVGPHVGAKGGGRPEMAQGKGTRREGLADALATVHVSGS